LPECQQKPQTRRYWSDRRAVSGRFGWPRGSTEDQNVLADEIIFSRQDLAKNGIKDETDLTLIRHIEISIPASAGTVDWRGIMAAYLVLREPA
jgi:hypothetical protein